MFLPLSPCPQVGGNSRAKEFFSSQGEIQDGMSLEDKYDSRTAALYRDKVRDSGIMTTQIAVVEMPAHCMCSGHSK